MVQRLYATNFITFLKPDGCLFLMLNTFQLKNLFMVLIMSSATVAYEEGKGVVGWLAVLLALTCTLKEIFRNNIYGNEPETLPHRLIFHAWNQHIAFSINKENNEQDTLLWR